MIGFSGGALLVALVSGNLLRDSVAEGKNLNFILVTVKCRFSFHGVAAVENKYIHVSNLLSISLVVRRRVVPRRCLSLFLCREGATLSSLTVSSFNGLKSRPIASHPSQRPQ